MTERQRVEDMDLAIAIQINTHFFSTATIN